MVKNMKFRETMRILGLRTSENNSERTIVRNIFDAYQSIGSKGYNNDVYTSWQVLTSTIMGKEMAKNCMVSKTSKSLRISRTTLLKAIVRWEKIENSNETSFWSFQGRLPCKDKVIFHALRTLLAIFVVLPKF